MTNVTAPTLSPAELADRLDAMRAELRAGRQRVRDARSTGSEDAAFRELTITNTRVLEAVVYALAQATREEAASGE